MSGSRVQVDGSTRREAIRLGLAGLAAMGISALAPTPALATTGAFTFGADNHAGDDSTGLDSANMSQTLSVGNSGFGTALVASIAAGASVGTAVDALTGGRGNAVSARIFNTENSSAALLARTYGTGYALYLDGGKAQLCVNPGATAGAPAAGDHVMGEHYTDSAGREYVCVVSGTPGTWVPALRGGANNAAVEVTSPSASPAIKAKGSTAGSAALAVEGKLTLTRSGKARIASGKSSVTVTVPGGGLGSSSMFLCTPQDSAGSGVYVAYAQRLSSSQFQIKLNKACTSSVYVGWMVLG